MNVRSLFAPLLIGLSSVSGCQFFVSAEVGKPVGATCTEDAECQGMPCLAGLCTTACSVNQDCIDALGDNHVCRKSLHACMPLLSEDCTRIVGNYKSDDAVIFGTLLAVSGGLENLGKPQQNAIELAVQDFTSVSSGLPPLPGGKNRRPIVFVECDDQGKNDVIVRAAKHLVDVVGVPAILGSSLSGTTLVVANEVTIPGNVLMIGPSITSPALTSLQDNNLLWRTVASIDNQNLALANFYTTLEKDLKMQLGLPPEQGIKVAVVYRNDTFGKTSTEALEMNLVINGKTPGDNASNYLRTNYGNPSDLANDPPVYDKTASDIVNFKPHVIFLFGADEVLDNLIPLLEKDWAEPKYRPWYLSSWAIETKHLWDYVKANDPADSLRKRLLLTVSGSNGDAYKSFRLAYTSFFKDGTIPDTPGASQAYDSMYVLGYATYALLDKEINGPNLAASIANLVALEQAPVKVGGNNINTTFTTLSQGTKVNLEGASGNLDFDLATGDVKDEVQMTCLPKPAGEVQPPTYSGFYLDIMGMPHGSVAEMRTFCNF